MIGGTQATVEKKMYVSPFYPSTAGTGSESEEPGNPGVGVRDARTLGTETPFVATLTGSAGGR